MIATSSCTCEASRKGEKSGKLYYKANDEPPIFMAFLFGAQQLMVCVSSLLVIPFLVSSGACAGAATAFLRSRLISTTLFIAGISTLVQNIFGPRLPLLQGSSFTFLPPIFAFFNLPEMKCRLADNETDGTVAEDYQYLDRIQAIQGGLICASFVQVTVGLTGLVGVLARHIGPMTIAPLMIVLMLSVTDAILQDAEKHWISIVLVMVLVLVAIYLAEVQVPVPLLIGRKLIWKKSPIFTLFPYLLAIGFTWSLCVLMTVTGLEPPDGAARTDREDVIAVLKHAPWLRIPYPGQFGWPRFHTGVFMGFVAASVSSVVESVGAYLACARVCDERPPPAHAINRGIALEGLTCTMAGVFGSCCGITTYNENIGVIGITKVGSRMTLQITGVLLVLLGVFGKFGAVLATIPAPMIGGILTVSLAMIGGVGLSSVQLIDMRLSRNIAILGFSIMTGMLIPLHFERHPLNTGIVDVDQALNILLTVRMFVAGFIAFFLDNTVSGASRRQRGLQETSSAIGGVDDNGISPVRDAYSFSPVANGLLRRFPSLANRCPFLPTVAQSSSAPTDIVSPADIDRTNKEEEANKNSFEM